MTSGQITLGFWFCSAVYALSDQHRLFNVFFHNENNGAVLLVWDQSMGEKFKSLGVLALTVQKFDQRTLHC